MNKLLVMAVLALIAAAAFAQEAPKANEIYGVVWLDYDASGARFGGTGGMTASDFSFNRMRFGLRNALSDNVKTWFEFDPRNLEFRQVNVDWSPVANLDLIAGKQAKLFAQNNDWIFSDRTLGIQARYSLPGLGWAGIIVGNDADITNVSSKKLVFEGLASTPMPVAEVNSGVVKIYPQITVRPDLHGDITVEAGVNAEIAGDKVGISNPTGTAVNAYLLASGWQASLGVECTLVNVNDSNSANQDIVLYTRASYAADVIAPAAYFVVDNLAGTNRKAIGTFTNTSTPNATIMFELPFNTTKDLVVDLFFSYAISGYNLQEYYVQGYTTAQIASFPVNDWTAGLRIKYAFSAKW